MAPIYDREPSEGWSPADEAPAGPRGEVQVLPARHARGVASQRDAVHDRDGANRDKWVRSRGAGGATLGGRVPKRPLPTAPSLKTANPRPH